MIRFSKYIFLYALLSAGVLVPGVVSLVFNGLNPSIDFTGGTLLELTFDTPQEPDALEQRGKDMDLGMTAVQRSGDTTYIFRMKQSDRNIISEYLKDLNTQAGTLEVLRNETVGPTLGRELLTKTFVAAALAIMAILFYVAYSFKNITYGISAILALLHDTFVTLGLFSLFGYFFHVEVDTLFVTAVLTTMSFSVHDTIVVFDRIRELGKRAHKLDFEMRCDRALTETMNRSLVNSLTIIIMLVALILLGGESIRWFVIALLIGTVSGTYSSPFVATPTLILITRWKRRRKA